MELNQRVAIVTGGAAGMGHGIATVLAEAGATVAVADLREDVAAETAQELQDRGFQARPFLVDVSNGSQVEELIRNVVDTFGSVDILVNNAGIGQNSAVLEMPKGSFLCAQAAGKEMVSKGKGGRIVNIVSTAAENARVNAAAYCASKAGLLQLTRVLALELGQFGITVNAVGPGLTITGSPLRQPPSEAYQGAFLKEVPLARTGIPRDIAQAVAFLVSSMADYVTGQVIYVDGGYSAGKLSVRE